MLKSDRICQVKGWLDSADVNPLQLNNLGYILWEDQLEAVREENPTALGQLSSMSDWASTFS